MNAQFMSPFFKGSIICRHERVSCLILKRIGDKCDQTNVIFLAGVLHTWESLWLKSSLKDSLLYMLIIELCTVNFYRKF